MNATACRSCSLSQRCSPVRISGIVLRSGRRTALSPTRTCASSSRKTSESSFSSSSREDRTLTVGRSSSTRSQQYPHPQSHTLFLLLSYTISTPAVFLALSQCRRGARRGRPLRPQTSPWRSFHVLTHISGVGALRILQ